jgi:hypothetical protein
MRTTNAQMHAYIHTYICCWTGFYEFIAKVFPVLVFLLNCLKHKRCKYLVGEFFSKSWSGHMWVRSFELISLSKTKLETCKKDFPQWLLQHRHVGTYLHIFDLQVPIL